MNAAHLLFFGSEINPDNLLVLLLQLDGRLSLLDIIVNTDILNVEESITYDRIRLQTAKQSALKDDASSLSCVIYVRMQHYFSWK